VPDLLAIASSRLPALWLPPCLVTVATIVAVFHIVLHLRRRRVLAAVIIAIMRPPASARVPTASTACARGSSLLLLLPVAVFPVFFVVPIAVVCFPRPLRMSWTSRAGCYRISPVAVLLLVILLHQRFQVLA
jgi:hypothetical protein